MWVQMREARVGWTPGGFVGRFWSRRVVFSAVSVCEMGLVAAFGAFGRCGWRVLLGRSMMRV